MDSQTYNSIVSFIWLLSNRKEKRRQGKIQLIDATGLKSPLRKNLGQKNCEFTLEIRQQIIDTYMNFEENEGLLEEVLRACLA